MKQRKLLINVEDGTVGVWFCGKRDHVHSEFTPGGRGGEVLDDTPQAAASMYASAVQRGEDPKEAARVFNAHLAYFQDRLPALSGLS